jgi:hypothetical protein
MLITLEHFIKLREFVGAGLSKEDILASHDAPAWDHDAMNAMWPFDAETLELQGLLEGQQQQLQELSGGEFETRRLRQAGAERRGQEAPPPRARPRGEVESTMRQQAISNNQFRQPRTTNSSQTKSTFTGRAPSDAKTAVPRTTPRSTTSARGTPTNKPTDRSCQQHRDKSRAADARQCQCNGKGI